MVLSAQSACEFVCEGQSTWVDRDPFALQSYLNIGMLSLYPNAPLQCTGIPTSKVHLVTTVLSAKTFEVVFMENHFSS
ncbi:hypothetical protein NPIL_169861 [Nephila pilipes]|uniref:Uncharacterized protein n=1 Tax=Nephila pilipes TaxID=299642 RepID=A0A8X6KI88_NEPPI|nr:hypothetical protein NPIL_169861 [Nephila pilipes]